jgi:hypothetical protein
VSYAKLLLPITERQDKQVQIADMRQDGHALTACSLTWFSLAVSRNTVSQSRKSEGFQGHTTTSEEAWAH